MRESRLSGSRCDFIAVLAARRRSRQRRGRSNPVQEPGSSRSR
jgi:hypothetical protein